MKKQLEGWTTTLEISREKDGVAQRVMEQDKNMQPKAIRVLNSIFNTLCYLIHLLMTLWLNQKVLISSCIHLQIN